jgi:hypothetical protein
MFKYYSDAPDITSMNWEVGKRALMIMQEVGKMEVSGKILCRDMHELVDNQRGDRRSVHWPHDYLFIGEFAMYRVFTQMKHKLNFDNFYLKNTQFDTQN